MWFDDGIIKKCSKCSCLILETHLISGNTKDAVYWIDGKMEAPMFPVEPELIKCQQCSSLVWLAELQEIEASDYNNKDIVNKVEQHVIAPSFDDYFSFLEMGCLEPTKELYLRIRAWWAGNDSRRRGDADKPLSEREIINLTMLAEILDVADDDCRIMKAEIFRELGRFKDANYLICDLRGRDQSLTVTTILSLIDKEQSHLVRLINEEPSPLVQIPAKHIRPDSDIHNFSNGGSMASLNKVMIIGNLGKDPEIRTTPSGQTVATFSVATSEKFKNKSGEQEERTEWHNIVLWGKLAEIAGQYLTKGKTVYIEGRVQTRKWEGKDGQDRYTTEIVGDKMQMLGGREGSTSGTNAVTNERSITAFIDEDDIPFY